MSITFDEDVWSKCNLLLKLLWIIEILTEKTVLCFRNIRVVSKEKDQLMSFQDKILDLSWIFRNLLLDILPIEISVFYHLWRRYQYLSLNNIFKQVIRSYRCASDTDNNNSLTPDWVFLLSFWIWKDYVFASSYIY